MKELYFSVDVETDGPIPGDNSMLSLGAVAFSEEGMEAGEFYVNIAPLIHAKQDKDTMEWWRKHQEEWEQATIGARNPTFVMVEFVKWVETLAQNHRSRPVFVGYPAGFDFTFVYWYCHHFVGRSPFKFQGIDMKSFAMALLGTDFKNTVKKTMPKKWIPKSRHTHIAVEDAREQGDLFIAMLNASKETHRART